MEVDGEKIRILLIEDNPGDARLIREMLAAKESASFDLEHADRLSTGLARLARGGIDVILLDLSLPDSQGLDGLNKICAQAPEAPVVVLSGLSDEAVAVNAVHEGAQDYLVKGSVDSALLVRSLRYAIERQHLRVALRESESRYRLLADNATDVIWTANMKWQITHVSPSIKRLLGYTVEEMKRLAIKDILTPDSLKQAGKLIRNQMDIMTPRSQHPPMSLTLEHVRKDGSTLWAEVMLSFLWDKDGKLREVLGVSRDITERKKAEEALRESEEELQAIFDSSMNGIALLDLEGRVIRVNKRVLEVGGYDTEDISGKPLDLLKMFTPESIERMSSVRDMILSGKEGTAFECELYTKSGTKMSLEINVGPFLLKGQLFGIVAVMRDITERKRAEEALRESEERFRTVFEGTSLGIALVDFNGKALSINPAFERMTGYNMEEFKEIEGSLKYLHPDDAMTDANLYIELLKGKREDYTVDKRYIRKDGGVIWGRQTLSVVRSAEGKPIYFVAMVEDITERKRMEDALRDSEEKYRLYFENASDVIYSLDPKGTILSMSPVVEKMLGYKPEELIGKNIFESNLQTPETMEKALFNISRVLAGEHGLPTEGEFIAKDGTRILGEISGAPIFSSDGKVIAIVCVGRDITERKKADEALRESERRLKDAMALGNSGYWEFDIDMQNLFWSDQTFKLFERDPSLGAPSVEEEAAYYSPEQVVKLREYGQRAIEKRESIEYDFVVKLPSGKSAYMMGFMRPVSDVSGKVVKLFGVFHDITERKRMEEEISLLSDAVKMSKDGIAITDLEGRIIEVNEATLKMHGMDNRADLIGRPALELISAEDCEMVTEKMTTALAEGGLPYILEYHCLKNDGSTFICEATVSEIKDKKGENTGYMAVARDITERKRIHEALRTSEERLRIITENMNDLVSLVDAEGNYLYLSPVYKSMFGDDPDQDLGKNVIDFAQRVHPDDRKKYVSIILETTSNPISGSVQYRYKHTSGSYIWVESQWSILTGENGQLMGAVIVNRDITERRRMEDTLRQSEQDYRTLFDTTIDGMAVIDAETMRVLLINQPILQKYGSGLSEDIFKGNLLNFVHPEDRERALKLIVEDLFEKDARKFVKIRLINSDGKMFWASCTGARIKYQGRPAGLVSLRDITEQQEAEDALRDSEERFRRLVDQAPDIIFRFSDEKGLEYCSPIVCKVTGYTAEELLAEPKIGVELAKGFDAGLAEDYERTVIKGASLRTREISFVHKDGRRIYLDMRSHAVRDKEGKVIAYEGILRDITERKRMEEELHLLSDAVRMTAESVSIVDLKGRIVDVNEAGLKMQGLENKADLVGKNPFDIIIPEDQPKALETMAKILAEGSLQTVEYHIITNDGRKALIETSVSLIRGEKGEPKSIVAVARDITERRRIEEALRESEKRYRLLAENLRDVIWTVDMNWRLTYVSPSITQLAGYSVEEYITKNWDEIVAPASVELLTNVFNEELALEASGHSDLLRSRTFEVELKCKDGSTVPVEMKATFLRGPDGRPTGILGVSRDITARRKAEEEKQKLEEQLQLAGRLAAVGELAAGVAHELNNPIAAIKGYAQFLTARKDLDETIRKDLDTIFRESQRATKITQNLLSFARRHEPEKHPVSINDVIENILEMQEHMMKVNNIELEMELAPDLPKTMADFHQMQQVFMNIVNNAEQAMIEAHGKGRLLIKTRRAGKMVQITFADNGPGISEENLKRIFDPFFTTKEVGKGTGLGLSICYGLIEAHGGRIYAKSKLGQGATFVIEMPIVSENQLVAEAALLNPGLRGVKWNKPGEQY